jgi:hypothetical protein
MRRVSTTTFSSPSARTAGCKRTAPRRRRILARARTGALLTLASLLALGTLGSGLSMGDARDPARPALAGPACRGSAKTLARVEMLFGTLRPDASSVSDEEWSRFLDEEVTPRFPSGLTVLQGAGQWRGRHPSVTKEQSKILVIWHEPTSRAETDIEAIRAAYRTRFNQDSVMRVDGVSCVSF